MSMHKEIIAAVAKSEGLTQAAVKGVLNAYHAGIMAALMGGETIRMRGFGTFKAADRAEREGKNPKTGEKLTIAATTVPKFSAGAGFKAAVAK